MKTGTGHTTAEKIKQEKTNEVKRLCYNSTTMKTTTVKKTMQTTVKHTMSPGTKAARKAWRTMRKNSTPEQISERARAAAHKAWITIRAKKAAQKKADLKAARTARN